MPTINSARDEEKSEERSRESIQQLQKQIEELQQQINGHFSQTIEKEDDNDSIDTLLMDGVYLRVIVNHRLMHLSIKIL